MGKKLEYNKPIEVFKPKEKKKLRELLNRLKENCKKQNEEYYKLFLKANDDIIKAIDRFLLNPPYNIKRHEQIGIKHLKHIIDKAQEYKKEVMEKILKINLK